MKELTNKFIVIYDDTKKIIRYSKNNVGRCWFPDELNGKGFATKSAADKYINDNKLTVDDDTIIDDFISDVPIIPTPGPDVTDKELIDSLKAAVNGSVLVKSGGKFVASPIIVDDAKKLVTFFYDVQTPPNSLRIGLNTSIHENGGFLEYNTRSLNKNYILLDYENDPNTGTSRPLYYQRGPKETRVELQPDASTEMLDVQEITVGNISFNRQVQKAYFRFKDAVKNFKMAVEINGNILADYPVDSWDRNSEPGYDLLDGEQSIVLAPMLSELTSYNVRLLFKADTPINMLGNGTLPWYALDLNRITTKEVALREDITSGGGGGTLPKNLLTQDLADVELDKLYDKGTDAKLAAADLSNVDETRFNDKVLLSQAFADLSSKFEGLSPRAIKRMFKVNYFELVGGDKADLSRSPYTASTLYLAYQFDTDNQVIEQILPPISQNKIIIISVIRDESITGTVLRLTPNGTDTINGALRPYEITDGDGYEGILIPINNSNGYEFMHKNRTSGTLIKVADDKDNIEIGKLNLKFKKATVSEEDGDIVVTPDLGGGGVLFSNAGDSNGSGTSNNVIVEAPLLTRAKINSDGVQEAQVVYIDHGYYQKAGAPGLFGKLSMSTEINTDHSNDALFFDQVSFENPFVYTEELTKSVILQDISNLDPNITGGTEFEVGFAFYPTTGDTASEDGYIELKLVNADTGDYLMDSNKRPIAVRKLYKQDQKIEKQLLRAAYYATGAVKAKFEIDCSFKSTILKIHPDTCFFVQSISKDKYIGIAKMAFELQTGYRLSEENRYYGNNLMMFDFGLQKDKPEMTYVGNESQGDGCFVSSINEIKVSVSNGVLNIKDAGGLQLPVISLGKLFSAEEAADILGLAYKVGVSIVDKDDAFRIAVLSYKGSTAPTLPILTGYNNDQPVWAAGWTADESHFISEDYVSGDHVAEFQGSLRDDKDIRNYAVVMYPVSSQIPIDFSIHNFHLDISNPFTKIVISDTSHISENYLTEIDVLRQFKTYATPNLASLRYTVNNTPTKLPFGEINKPSDFIEKADTWTDNTGFQIFEGDLAIKKDCKLVIDISTSAFAGEAIPDGLTSNNKLYLAKVVGDQLTKVVGSETSFTMKQGDKVAHSIALPTFVIQAKKGEKYRLIGESDIKDGFFIQNSADKNLIVTNIRIFENVMLASDDKGQSVDLSEYDLSIDSNGFVKAKKK